MTPALIRARLKFIHLFAADVSANPNSYRIAVRTDPYRHAEQIIAGLALNEVRRIVCQIQLYKLLACV